MKRILLINLFFISCLSIHAQTTLISGKIIVDDADDVINMRDFLIENLTTNAHTKTNDKGLFSIRVNVNDNLVFRQIGIEERQLKISEAMIKKGFVTVHVNIEVIELAETRIKPLKKYWKDNVSKDEPETDKINKSLGINKEFKFDMIKAHYATEYLKKTNIAFTYENVLAMMDMFTAVAKSHKEEIRAVSKYDKIEKLKDYFTEYYFINDLKISKGNILEFIHYCYVEHRLESLLKENNYDKITLVFQEQAPNYLSIINQKPIEYE